MNVLNWNWELLICWFWVQIEVCNRLSIDRRVEWWDKMLWRTPESCKSGERNSLATASFFEVFRPIPAMFDESEWWNKVIATRRSDLWSFVAKGSRILHLRRRAAAPTVKLQFGPRRFGDGEVVVPYFHFLHSLTSGFRILHFTPLRHSFKTLQNKPFRIIFKNHFKSFILISKIVFNYLLIQK